MGALVTEDTATVSNQLRCDGGRMILSENSSTLGSRCCSAARSETEWQRNESWKVRLLRPAPPPKLNMQARVLTAASGRAAGYERCTGGECGTVVA